jgi:RNA polymerase subunit RPABC4/transcription elongation factor Spt4
MFFFIGGIQPRTVTVDDTPRLCPACGLAQARRKRIDHYFSLFFIPLFPVKRGPVMLVCDRCQGVFDSNQPMLPSERRTNGSQPRVCRHCGQALAPAFSYCPSCGSRV